VTNLHQHPREKHIPPDISGCLIELCSSVFEQREPNIDTSILIMRKEQDDGKIWRFLSNFSAKNLLINSHQAHQIAAHPFHHLPMGVSDDNPSSFGDHYGFGHHAGLDGL
jgi:hypothetical protein